MVPDKIVLDCAAEMLEFRRVVSELDMPQLVDIDALLSQVFDAVMRLEYFDNALKRVAQCFAEQEGLFELCDGELSYDDGYYSRLSIAVIRLGYAIKNKLHSFNAYRAGYFPYNFRTHYNDHCIVLIKNPDPG